MSQETGQRGIGHRCTYVVVKQKLTMKTVRMTAAFVEGKAAPAGNDFPCWPQLVEGIFLRDFRRGLQVLSLWFDVRQDLPGSPSAKHYRGIYSSRRGITECAKPTARRSASSTVSAPTAIGVRTRTSAPSVRFRRMASATR